MPQLNRIYESGAAKRRKKEESRKIDARCKGLMDRFVSNSPSLPSSISKFNDNSAIAVEKDNVADVKDMTRNATNSIASSNQFQDSEQPVVTFDNAESSRNATVSVQSFDLGDIGNWPQEKTAFIRDSILEAGPPKPPPSNFVYPKTNDRQFNSLHFYRKLSNGESFKRSWLVYSLSKDRVFCFSCKLYDVACSSSLGSMGFSNWKNVARCLHNHEVSVNHLQAMLTYHEARRSLEMSSSINDYLESATCKELEYWKKILHRLLAIVQYLAENNLSFRGSACHETIRDPRNGNFLLLAELLAKFDPIMAEHLEKVDSNTLSDHYLSKTIQNELIDLMSTKIVSEIVNHCKRQNIIQ